MTQGNEVLERFEEDVMVETAQGNRVPISFQVMQSIYNEITGKSEELGKQIRRRYKAKYEDLVQLNTKVEQFLEQYHVTSKNMSMTVFHTKDNKETFSSFDRFSNYDRSKLCSIKYIQLKYNFLIKLPHASKVQSFNLDIKIGSAVPHILKWKEEGMFGFIDEADLATAEVKINYVDFVVAQGLMSVIENWFNGLEKSEPTPAQKFIKKHKEQIATSIKLLLIISLSVFAFVMASNLDSLFSLNITSSVYFKTTILAIGTMFAIFWFSSKIESIVQRAFNEIYIISYIKLNRGDEIDIKKLEDINNKNFNKGIISLGFAITTGVCSSLIAWYITK